MKKITTIIKHNNNAYSRALEIVLFIHFTLLIDLSVFARIVPNPVFPGHYYNYLTARPAWAGFWINTFTIDNSLPEGKYILALAILDPAGMVPAVKFATQQYFNGGNHSIGYIGINTNIEQTTLESSVFDDPSKDNSLYCKIEN